MMTGAGLVTLFRDQVISLLEKVVIVGCEGGYAIVNTYRSNQDWIDQFRRRQAARRATYLEALEKIMVEALRPETKAEPQPASPLSQYRNWINTVGQWFVKHSWIVQQVQKRNDKTREASIDAGPPSEAVIDAEYEVIEIVEES